MPTLLPPDFEAAAITYLAAALTATGLGYAAGVTVTNKAPHAFPASLIVVRRDGGPRDRLFDRPRLTTRVWASSDATATDLADLAGALLVAWHNASVVAATQLSGPSALPEENGKSLRVMVHQFQVRAVELV